MRGGIVAIVVASVALAQSAGALTLTTEDVVVLEGEQILTEDITADRIIIRATCCAYAANITLRATTSIQVNGVLASFPADVPRTLTLISGRDIVVAGALVGADGHDGSDVAVNGTASGRSGEEGGSIVLRWGTGGAFTLASGAVVRTGHGGDAGRVFASGETDTIHAFGGNGGQGGRLVLDGVVAHLLGTLAVGVGGNGGDVVISGPNQGASWTAYGGAGGASRFEPANDLLALTQTVSGRDSEFENAILGARGGEGGATHVVGFGSCGHSGARAGTGGEGWFGGRGGFASVDLGACAALDGEDGNPGCSGAAAGSSGAVASAIAGAGGPGRRAGGPGGDASAIGGRGGDGGDAGDPAPCASADGGRGGFGGGAFSVGGDGGCSGFAPPAEGGSAVARSGQGGKGGAGSGEWGQSGPDAAPVVPSPEQGRAGAVGCNSPSVVP